MKAFGYGLARVTGLNALFRALQADRVPILCYHSVVDVPVPATLARSGLHLPVERFAGQMAFLARRYRVIPLAEVIATVAARRPLPRRVAVVTFDDGYANNLAVAGPVLERYRIPATVFLATDYLSNGGLFWWDELALLQERSDDRMAGNPGNSGPPGEVGKRDLESASLLDRRRSLDRLIQRSVRECPEEAALRPALRPMTWPEARNASSLFSFGGHTAEHRVLPALSLSDQSLELERCREALSRELGLGGHVPFCYPSGRATRHSLGELGRLGFSGAVVAESSGLEERLCYRYNNVGLLPRLLINAGAPSAEFEAASAGIKASLGAILGKSPSAIP